MKIIRVHREITGSTNEDAFLMGMDGCPAWTVCTADSQTNGRGRLNREWYSPEKNGLYASVLVRPALSPREAGLLSFCAANAMTKSLRECGADVRIKWPNDLLLNSKKICGILSTCRVSDGKLRFAVIGSGVNLSRGSYPEELSDRATSLENEGFSIDRESLLSSYIKSLETEVSELEQNGYRGICDDYLKFCVTLGKQVNITGSIVLTGTAEGIAEDGALLVRDSGGILHTVLSGDVSVRGIAGYV